MLFVDVTFPPPRLIVFGAVDFAAALCRLARAAGWRPFVVDPRARFAQPRALPGRRGGRRRLAGGGVRAARRHRPRDRDRGAHPRPEARRRRADASRCARDAGYIGAMGSRRAQDKRRERLLAKGIDRRRAGAHLGADRARPRRADRRGDRAVDHGRDRRDAPRPRRAAGWPTPGAGSTRSACEVGGAGPRRRRGPPVRRDQAARASCDGRPLLEHAVEAMRGVAALEPVVVVLGHARRRDPRAGRPSAAPTVGGLRRLARGPGRVAALRRSRRSAGAPTRSWSRSATSPAITAAGDRRRASTAAATARRGARDLRRRPGHPVAAARGALLDRAGELRGRRRRSASCCAGARARGGGRRTCADPARHRHARGAGAAMKLEQSFEVQAPLDAGLGGADRPRARRAVPPRRGDHRPRRGRHLPRRVQGQARPDDRLLQRHDQDRGGRRGQPTARR